MTLYHNPVTMMFYTEFSEDEIAFFVDELAHEESSHRVAALQHVQSIGTWY